jgi:hypothetical protein
MERGVKIGQVNLEQMFTNKRGKKKTCARRSGYII